MKKTGTITVDCKGIGKRKYKKGIVVKDIVEKCKEKIPYPTIIVSVDNKLNDLDYRLIKDCHIDFLHLGTPDGRFCYQRSISFVLAKAIEELYPKAKLYIKHSLSKGFYCELEFSPPQNIKFFHIETIKKRMQEIIDANLPFIRNEVYISDAIKLFEEKERFDKSRILKYRTDKRVSIYNCGKTKNHFYGFLVPSTGYLKHFDLILYPPGFIMLFPDLSKPNTLPPFVEQLKMFQVFKEYSDWGNILGVRTAADLNEIIDSGHISDFIKMAEALHEKKIAMMADEIKNRLLKPRLILISGPSSSGKTTFSKRLTIQLKVNGENPVIVNLDDYFVERQFTPKDEFGNFDFECFKAIDYKLFNQHLFDLLNGKEITLPKYSFMTGMRIVGNKLRINDDQIIIIEGIHGLNRQLSEQFPEVMKYKIYVSALTMINLDNHNRIPTTDTRIIRRIVRDNFFRGYTALDTIRSWQRVRSGEDKFIFPYQERADIMFNSVLVYELAVLKQYAMPLLKKITPKYPEYIEARRLIKFLSYFREISTEELPPTSILREFIGGSSFSY